MTTTTPTLATETEDNDDLSTDFIKSTSVYINKLEFITINIYSYDLPEFKESDNGLDFGEELTFEGDLDLNGENLGGFIGGSAVTFGIFGTGSESPKLIEV